jgi:hypothetical protein
MRPGSGFCKTSNRPLLTERIGTRDGSASAFEPWPASAFPYRFGCSSASFFVGSGCRVAPRPVGGSFRALGGPHPGPGRVSDLRFSPGRILHTLGTRTRVGRRVTRRSLRSAGSRLPCPSPGDAASSSLGAACRDSQPPLKAGSTPRSLPPQADLAARPLDHCGRLVGNSRGSSLRPPILGWGLRDGRNGRREIPQTRPGLSPPASRVPQRAF